MLTSATVLFAFPLWLAAPTAQDQPAAPALTLICTIDTGEGLATCG